MCGCAMRSVLSQWAMNANICGCGHKFQRVFFTLKTYWCGRIWNRQRTTLCRTRSDEWKNCLCTVNLTCCLLGRATTDRFAFIYLVMRFAVRVHPQIPVRHIHTHTQHSNRFCLHKYTYTTWSGSGYFNIEWATAIWHQNEVLFALSWCFFFSVECCLNHSIVIVCVLKTLRIGSRNSNHRCLRIFESVIISCSKWHIHFVNLVLFWRNKKKQLKTICRFICDRFNNFYSFSDILKKKVSAKCLCSFLRLAIDKNCSFYHRSDCEPECGVRLNSKTNVNTKYAYQLSVFNYFFFVARSYRKFKQIFESTQRLLCVRCAHIFSILTRRVAFWFLNSLKFNKEFSNVFVGSGKSFSRNETCFSANQNEFEKKTQIVNVV